jgi:hypothetical protein
VQSVKLTFYFLAVLEFELRALTLAGQVIYHLSQSSNSLCVSYFSLKTLLFAPGLALDCNLPTYILPGLLIEVGSHYLFCWWLASNFDPSNHHHSSS